jgi:hypothetical protein
VPARKNSLNEGHGFSRAVKSHSYDGFARLGGMPDEIGTSCSAEVLVVTKKFAANH